MAFGDKKRRKEEEAAYLAQVEAHKIMAAESLKTGRTGSAEVFSQAWQKANDSLARHKLMEGAVQAFMHDGHVENVRVILSDREKIKVDAADLLKRLTKDSDQAVAIINLALHKLSDQQTQEALDSALSSHISSGVDYYGHNKFTKADEAFTTTLLQAGANANAYEGRIFALAIAQHSPEVVKMLRTRGGKFEDALLIMQIEDWERKSYGFKGCVDKLRSYQEHENGSAMEQLQQNVKDLTERLDKAEGRIAELEGRKKKPAASATPSP